ncbi:MAG: Hpt domain-containing protein, partial [Chloroflexota bacterium]
MNLPSEERGAAASKESPAPNAPKDTTPIQASPPESHLNPNLLPATMDSIDMVSALARLGDNRVLYRRMLLMFHEDHKQDVPAIRAALQSNDREFARRLAHTLKGLAGSIGADELREVSKDLEKAIAEENEPAYEGLLSQVEQKMAVVMASIALI